MVALQIRKCLACSVIPGRVSSRVRVPPPISSLPSMTITRQPARASVTAAARPLGPDPTITASKSVLMVMLSGHVEVATAVNLNGHVGFPGLTLDELADLEVT